MSTAKTAGPAPGRNPTSAMRKSDLELVVTRTINGPARLVFEAWTRPELFQRWWVPKSCDFSMISCALDVRTGGSYRLEMGFPPPQPPMAFFGRYLEVVPPSRIVWTNEEEGDGGAVTTVTFEEKGGVTLVTVSDLYPSKAALDAAIASGSTGGWDEQFEQLDALVLSLNAGADR